MTFMRSKQRGVRDPFGSTGNTFARPFASSTARANPQKSQAKRPFRSSDYAHEFGKTSMDITLDRDSQYSGRESTELAQEAACKHLAQLFAAETRDFFVRVSFTQPDGRLPSVLVSARSAMKDIPIESAWLTEDVRKKGGGEHIYGVIVVRHLDDAAAFRQAWIAQTNARPKLAVHRYVKGAQAHVTGKSDALVDNLAKVVRYALRQRADNSPRDLVRGVLATGALAPAWTTALSTGIAQQALGSPRACEHCGRAILPGSRGQQRFLCSSRCRTRACRARQKDSSAINACAKRSAAQEARLNEAFRKMIQVARAAGCVSVRDVRRIAQMDGIHIPRDASRMWFRELDQMGFARRTGRGWEWLP